MLKINPVSIIRRQRIDSLKKKITQKAETKRKIFYSEYQRFDDVRDFEVRESVIKAFIDGKPEQVSEKQYLTALKALNSNNNNNKKAGEYIKYIQDLKKSPYQTAVLNYYAQQEFLYPTYESLRKNIDFERNHNPKAITEDNVQEGFNKTNLLKILKESKDLTLDSESVLRKKYNKDTIYDLPLRFATACYNSRDLGNGYIFDKTPKVFEGVSQEDIIEAIDLFSTRYRECFHGREFDVAMKIGEKDFIIRYLKSGKESLVFRILDEENNTAILKLFKTTYRDNENNITFAPFGAYGNIGILREANKAGVKDVPELYIANPIYLPIENKGNNYLGGWEIVEDIDNRCNDIPEGLKVEDWLHSIGLILPDYVEKEWIGNILVDLGFVSNSKNKNFYKDEYGSKLVNQVYSGYLNFETTEDLIKLLEN